MIKNIWNQWKKIAGKIGDFQFNLFLSLLYWLLVFPVGQVANLFGDFFKVKDSPKWEDVEDRWSNLFKLKEQ